MTQVYNIHEAKTHFSKLIAAVERGERVTICRNGAPVMECRPARPQAAPFPFGAWAGVATPERLARLAEPTDPETLGGMGL